MYVIEFIFRTRTCIYCTPARIHCKSAGWITLGEQLKNLGKRGGEAFARKIGEDFLLCGVAERLSQGLIGDESFYSRAERFIPETRYCFWNQAFQPMCVRAPT